MSFIIAMKSSDNTISYYQKRLSTTRNGVKGSYPIFVDNVDDAYRFITSNRAIASMTKLNEFYGNQSHDVKFVIVEFSELVEEDKLEETILKMFEPKIEDIIINDINDDLEVDDQEEHYVTKDSVLSNAYASNFLVVDEDGYTNKAFSVHQVYHDLIDDYVDRHSSEYELTSQIDDVREFDEVRQSTMFNVLYHRYLQDKEFKKALLETGDKRLVVLSKNNFWGDNYGQGHNVLGLLLEKLRDLHQFTSKTY